MKMTTFSRPAVHLLQGAMAKALEAIAAEYGVTITQAGGSFDAYEATLKFKVTITSEEAQALNAKATNDTLDLLGIKARVGDKVRMSGRVYEITGVNLASRKMPVLARRDDGKTFKLSAQAVIFASRKAVAS